MAKLKGGLADALSAESEDDGESELDTAKEDAAGAAMSALKSGDVGAFKSAMADFVKLCTEGDY